MDDPSADRRDFRLIELLVVVAIILLGIGMLLPLGTRVHDDGARTQCQNNLKQMGLAIYTYAENHKVAWPALSSAPRGATWANGKGDTYPQSFFFTILPFIEGDDLYKAGMSPDTNGDTWRGNVPVGTTLGPLYTYGYFKPYVCPADPTNSLNQTTPGGWVGGSYAANYQVFGTANWTPKYNLGDIPDGTSNTVALSERFAYLPGPGGQFTDPAGMVQQAGNLWAWPANSGTSPPTPYKGPVTRRAALFAYCNVGNSPPAGYGPVVFSAPQVGIDPGKADYRLVQSGHKHVVQVGMCDGSARGVAATVSQPTWQNALLPDDGVPLGEDW